MLQPDVFFSYGLCAGLAVAAGKKAKEENCPWVNKYFLGALAWLSLLYVPQVLYLVWKFPAWESMFAFKDFGDYPPWFMAVYSAGVILVGVLGFYITFRLMRGGKTAAAMAQVGWSMLAATIIVFAGWDGTGYQRLLYVGSGAEWAAGVSYPMTDFFKSSIFITLIWLEALVLLPYNIMFIRWARQSR